MEKDDPSSPDAGHTGEVELQVDGIFVGGQDELLVKESGIARIDIPLDEKGDLLSPIGEVF